MGLAGSLLLTALVMSVALRFVVERAKKCLDFVATYHFFHFMATCVASGFPQKFQWWAIHFVALLTAVLPGEYICMLGETQAIQLSKKPEGKSSKKKVFGGLWGRGVTKLAHDVCANFAMSAVSKV